MRIPSVKTGLLAALLFGAQPGVFAAGLDLSPLTDSKWEGGACPVFTERRPAVSNGGVVLDDTALFVHSYLLPNGGAASGDVKRFELSALGVPETTAAWSASSKLPSWGARRIATFDPVARTGIPFTADDLAGGLFLGNLLVTPEQLGGDLDTVLTAAGFPEELEVDVGIPCDTFSPVLFQALGVLLGCRTTVLGIPVFDDSGNTDLLDLTIPLRTDELLGLTGLRSGLSVDDVNYIRGERANEVQNGGELRDRQANNIVGPFFKSNPVWVGPPAFDYPDGFPTGTTQNYSAFRAANINRTPMVYIGGSDGMLHGFDAATGVEKFAYVPSMLGIPLKRFTDPAFVSRPFVDGQLSVVDVYLESHANCGGLSCWRTVLVGALGGGGQGVFALDVTDPTVFDLLAPGATDHDGSGSSSGAAATAASTIVLWEFNDQSGNFLTDLETLVGNLLSTTLCQALNIGDPLSDFLNDLPGIGGIFAILPLDTILGSLVTPVTDAVCTAITPTLQTQVIDPLLDGVFTTLQATLELDTNEYGHPGLGYTYGQPNIVRMNDGNWYAVFGNGYGNTDLDLGLEDSVNEGLPNLTDDVISALFGNIVSGTGTVLSSGVGGVVQLGFSATGFGYLYIVNLGNGALHKSYATQGVGDFVNLENLLGHGLNTNLPELVDGDGNATSQGVLNNLGNFLGNANGLATPASVDTGLDLSFSTENLVAESNTVDLIYVGDLYGNLWKLDATDSSSSLWGWTRMFDAVGATDDDSGLPANTAGGNAQLQSIISQPDVIRHPDQDLDGFLVLFGTGALFDEDDLPGTGLGNTMNSFYALWDKNDGSSFTNAFSRGSSGSLLQRVIWREVTGQAEGDFRLTSRDSHASNADLSIGLDEGPIDWTANRGWYFDLRLNGTNGNGERVVGDPIIRNSRVLFTGLVPDSTLCENESSGDTFWTYQLRAGDGSPPFQIPFDVNGDGVINIADLSNSGFTVTEGGEDITLNPAARRTGGTTSGELGSPAAPVLLVTQDGKEIHIQSTGDGGTEVNISQAAGFERSRSSWQQLK